jgi:hypothetical protein
MKNTTALQKSFKQQIARWYEKFESQGKDLAGGLVEHFNTARRIGILIQEWSGHEQITFTFFNAHQKELPFSFDVAKHFVFLANRLDKPAKKLEDIPPRLWQMDFQAAGLLTLPDSVPHDRATALPIYVQFTKCLGDAKERFWKWTADEPVESRPADVKLDVKTELKPFVDLYARL